MTLQHRIISINKHNHHGRGKHEKDSNPDAIINPLNRAYQLIPWLIDWNESIRGGGRGGGAGGAGGGPGCKGGSAFVNKYGYITWQVHTASLISLPVACWITNKRRWRKHLSNVSATLFFPSHMMIFWHVRLACDDSLSHAATSPKQSPKISSELQWSAIRQSVAAPSNTTSFRSGSFAY